jgi:nucleoside-diphosphate-sugar epimerase
MNSMPASAINDNRHEYGFVLQKNIPVDVADCYQVGLADRCKPNARCFQWTSDMDEKTKHTAEICADIDDLMRDVGFRPATPIAEGVRRFVVWYREFHRL